MFFCLPTVFLKNIKNNLSDEHAHAIQHHFVLIEKGETKSATVDDETNRQLQNQMDPMEYANGWAHIVTEWQNMKRKLKTR